MFSQSSCQAGGKVRTKDKHRHGRTQLIAGLKSALTRSSATLAADALGAMALVVILVVGLHLPALV